MEQSPINREHPLENSLIIRHIFKHCTAQDQKSFRLVCRAWHRYSLKDWRSSRKIIVAHRAVPWRQKDFRALMNSKFSNYSEMPYDTISVFDYELLDRNFEKLFTICGSHLKVVYLDNITFKSLDDFRHVVFRCFPNMRELSLTGFKVCGTSRMVSIEPSEWMEPQFEENRNLKTLKYILPLANFAVPFMELLGHFPSLEKLSFCVRNGYLDRIFSSLNIIRKQDPTKLKLTKVDIKGFQETIPQVFISFLRDPGIRLEKLHVPLSGDHEAVTLAIRDIFHFHGSSLKSLKLQRYGLEPSPTRLQDPYFCIPNYPSTKLLNLKELLLSHAAFNSLDFLRVMPNLTKLKYYITSGINEQVANVNGILLQHCKELELMSWWEAENVSIEAMSKIIDWMPNMEVLKMSFLDNETFAIICERWPNLVKLNFVESAVDDVGFTGFDQKNVKRINRQKTRSSRRQTTERKPNITSLKNLRHLEIDTCEECKDRGRPMLNYCAAVYGIQEMPSLETLEFDCCHVKDKELWKNLMAAYPST